MRNTEHIILRYHLTSAMAERFWAKVEKRGPDECWPWQASTRKSGYGRFRLVDRINVTASRLAYALHHQIDPGEKLVCHRCDNPPCCNPAHLWLGTNDQNMADMAAKGRTFNPPAKGEANGNAKLSAEQVEMVKGLIRRKRTNVEIARAFGVTHQLISRIRRGKAWGDGTPMSARYASLKK